MATVAFWISSHSTRRSTSSTTTISFASCRRGNFAFGERKNKAITYRDGFIFHAVNIGSNNPGVLIYSVDATLASGKNPLVVHGRDGIKQGAIYLTETPSIKKERL